MGVKLSRRDRDRIERLCLADAGHGYDPFGLSRKGVAVAVWLLRFWYERYFRVSSVGAEQIPASGPVILAANHGGALPFDAAMLYLDVLRHSDPPRLARPVADFFVAELPFVNTLFSRAGVVGGSRGNVRRLLELGELLLIFPEGTPGIGKPASERYRLQRWRVGHAELALRHRVPVIPVALVGPEEQWPQLMVLRRLHPFGAPHLPVPMTPLPLPVRYHLRYGAPLRLDRFDSRCDPDDPEQVESAAERVRRAVEALIEVSLRERRGLFR